MASQEPEELESGFITLGVLAFSAAAAPASFEQLPQPEEKRAKLQTEENIKHKTVEISTSLFMFEFLCPGRIQKLTDSKCSLLEATNSAESLKCALRKLAAVSLNQVAEREFYSRILNHHFS